MYVKCNGFINKERTRNFFTVHHYRGKFNLILNLEFATLGTNKHCKIMLRNHGLRSGFFSDCEGVQKNNRPGLSAISDNDPNPTGCDFFSS